MLYFCESTNKSYICKSSKDMEIKDRIKIIMEKENMASGAFAESIGIQQSTLSTFEWAGTTPVCGYYEVHQNITM